MISRTIEVESKSPVSWEDAVERAVQEASKTIDQIRSMLVLDYSALIVNNRISEYRANIQMTFFAKAEA